MTTSNITLLGLDAFDDTQRVTLYMRSGDKFTGYVHDTEVDDGVLIFKRDGDKEWMHIVGAHISAVSWPSGDV